MMYLGSQISHQGAKYLRLILVGLTLAIANTVSAASYVDLRRIEPIHGDAGAGAAKAVVCVACHGPNGNSVVALFPKLAGQKLDYLYYRLRDFKNANPKDPYYAQSPMTAQVANFTDEDMRNVAAYFAAQARTPAAAANDPGNGNGEVLYVRGDAARGIPPCQGCHGPTAAGPAVSQNQYAAYPSLRGQQSAYLVARLTNFRKGMPHGSTNDFIMQGVAQTLDDDAIAAVATWLGSLPPENKN